MSESIPDVAAASIGWAAREKALLQRIADLEGEAKANSPAPPLAVGSLSVVSGPMFAAKTTFLLRFSRRAHFARQSSVLVKYIHDTRFDAQVPEGKTRVVTHDGLSYDALACKRLGDILDQLQRFDVICIDEVQFMSDAVEVADALADAGKHVICAGLSGDFRGHPFEVMSRLYARADDVQWLAALCAECGAPAAFTKKTTGNTNDSAAVEEIGGAEKYSATCRRHHRQSSAGTMATLPPLAAATRRPRRKAAQSSAPPAANDNDRPRPPSLLFLLLVVLLAWFALACSG
jgi:thymidine kinase